MTQHFTQHENNSYKANFLIRDNLYARFHKKMTQNEEKMIKFTQFSGSMDKKDLV